MKKIKQLSQDVISKIAAGEVIERPVYAVKELVENSLDAGATMISVHIEDSGLKHITVIDNGEGMSAEDINECFKPHTTSKLENVDDLSQIASFGFRGEALSSIAAISRMTIQSKRLTDTAGTKIVLKHNTVEKITPIGMPHGTQITIDYLFHNLPARKKFLKSKRTEFRHIIDLISSMALSYPHLHFVLTHNGRTVLDLPPAQEPALRMQSLLGKDIFSALIPISYQDNYLTISGFITKPPITSRLPNKQFIFVNNRKVSDKRITTAVKNAYGTLLEKSAYPIGIFFFSLPFDHVDVNVHPRKEEIRFVNQQNVIDSVQQTVAATLAKHNFLSDGSYWETDDKPPLSLADRKKTTQSYAGKLLKEKTLPWELTMKQKPDIGKVMQLNNLYLLAPSDSGLILYDQHAVHERILYEQFKKEFLTEKININRFSFSKPIMFELSQSEAELLQEYLPVFSELGWEIEPFKGTSFVILALPILFQDRNYIVLLREILDDIAEEGKPKAVDAVSQKMIAYLACRGAVKAGDRLTKKQVKELLEQLDKTPNSMTCPHGRPTRTLISTEKLEKLFRR